MKKALCRLVHLFQSPVTKQLPLQYNANKEEFSFIPGKDVFMQLHLLSALLFVVSSNADNLIVGLFYGLRKIPIRWLSNFIIAFITSTGTVLSMVLGKSVLLFLPPNLGETLGGLIIVLIGSVSLILFFIKKQSVEKEDSPVRNLTVKESVLLGLALSINNIGLGIGASITGLSVLSTSLFSFLVCLLFLYLGNKIGRSHLSNLIGRFAEPAADLLMICLGLYEILI